MRTQQSGGDADHTRNRLIAAAREIFARQGYEGATIRAITRRVGVNVSAVTYHFGSKENLYFAVLHDVLSPLRDRVLEACTREGTTRARLGGVIRAVFEHLLDNPDQPRFMVGVRMGEGPFPPPVAEIIRPVFGALVELVEEGQAEGLIRTGPPLLFVFSLLSQPVYFTIISRRAPRGLLPVEAGNARGRELLLGHMMDVAFRGLLPGPDPSSTDEDPPGKEAS